MKILSFGAGMQSTALALMSCENVDAERKGHERPYPLVPVYDLVVFCDLGFEPPVGHTTGRVRTPSLRRRRYSI